MLCYVMLGVMYVTVVFCRGVAFRDIVGLIVKIVYKDEWVSFALVYLFRVTQLILVLIYYHVKDIFIWTK